MNELSFEEAFAKLEQAVQALEAGDLTLEQATRLFEEGMRLARLCHQHLNAAELKITQLQRDFSDQLAFLDAEEPPGAEG